MALVTLGQVKEALGLKPANTEQDSKISEAIPEAEDAIVRHTNDPWQIYNGTDPATARDFLFEDSGIHLVNPLQHNSITAVALVPPVGTIVDLTTTAGSYAYGPTENEYPAGWWVETGPANWGDGTAGFLRNLDVYLREHPMVGQAWKIRVTAKWGYTTIPRDVRRAAIWTTIAFIENPKPYASESIAQYTRSRGEREADPIPTRAARLLEPHIKT